MRTTCYRFPTVKNVDFEGFLSYHLSFNTSNTLKPKLILILSDNIESTKFVNDISQILEQKYFDGFDYYSKYDVVINKIKIDDKGISFRIFCHGFPVFQKKHIKMYQIWLK